ncbi:MAG: VWA domain-containing protein, partial [Anaerolineae bacterium]|nr:VWA domain-containing protein [Anaerolineae bacterium]
MNQEKLNIQLNSDKSLISKENTTQRILEIRVQAPEASKDDRRPDINLALVLDRSGSMNGAKLEYVKQAACHVLEQLQAQDQVALVVYDDTIQVLAHSMKVTHGNRFEIKQLISSITSGNMTNLRDGWLTGCREIAAAAGEGTINRTMLLTDGLANVGQTDPEILAQHAFELYKDSISTSTFGVGHGFNEHLLEAMANRGGGNFYYIERPERIVKIFLKEFEELIGITVRKVEVKIDLPMSMDWQVLGGWAAEYKDGSLHIYLGDMLSGRLQDLYVKLQVPAGAAADELKLNAKVFSQGQPGQVFEGQAETSFRYASGKEVEEAAVNQEVMQRFSVVELADAATEALKLERRGEREAANQLLTQQINLSRPYVSAQDSSNYEDMSARMKRGMDEADRKHSQW